MGKCLFDLRGQVTIPFYETWCKLFKQAQHVVGDKNLAIAFWASSDSYGGNINAFGYKACKLRGYALKNKGKGPSIGNGKGILKYPFRLLYLTPLHLEASKA